MHAAPSLSEEENTCRQNIYDLPVLYLQIRCHLYNIISEAALQFLMVLMVLIAINLLTRKSTNLHVDSKATVHNNCQYVLPHLLLDKAKNSYTLKTLPAWLHPQWQGWL